MKIFASIFFVGVSVLIPMSAIAQEPADGLIHGVVISVTTNDNNELVSFSVVNASGDIYDLKVRADASPTEYGLENRTGERWISNQSNGAKEAADQLLDHQQRFAPITVEATGGVASLVIEMESADLGTNLGFLFTIFAITWAGFFAYIFVMSRRQRDLERAVSTLTELSNETDVQNKQ